MTIKSQSKAKLDRVARSIAASVFRPQPHMSGDVFQAITENQRRLAEDAAKSAIEAMTPFRRYCRNCGTHISWSHKFRYVADGYEHIRCEAPTKR